MKNTFTEDSQCDTLQPHEKTSVYRIARGLLKDAHIITARMSKGYKFTLGDSIRKYAQEVTEKIFIAYEEKVDMEVKIERIREIAPILHKLLINYRIANDLQQVDRATYVHQISQIVSAKEQSEWWEQFILTKKVGTGQSLTTK